MGFSTFVLNLDRHHDRLAQIGQSLDALGLSWRRFPGLDALEVSDARLDRMVARNGPMPPFLRGARACTAGHMLMLAEIADGPDDHVLVLEDDADPSPALVRVLDALLARRDFDILNINRQRSRHRTRRLFVGRVEQDHGPLGVIRDLQGIHYGTAGYVIGREAARRVLSLCPRPDMPIDHVLFNPNISPVFGTMRIEQLFPALVRPRDGVATSIKIIPPGMTIPLTDKLRCRWSEYRILPRLLAGMAAGRYRLRRLDYRAEG